MEEERILVTKCNGDCRYLHIIIESTDEFENGYYCSSNRLGAWESINKKECDNCSKGKYLTGITRQAAIERMAKAICLERHACVSKSEMCGLCELWRNFSTHAESALDALLK